MYTGCLPFRFHTLLSSPPPSLPLFSVSFAHNFTIFGMFDLNSSFHRIIPHYSLSKSANLYLCARSFTLLQITKATQRKLPALCRYKSINQFTKFRRQIILLCYWLVQVRLNLILRACHFIIIFVALFFSLLFMSIYFTYVSYFLYNYWFIWVWYCNSCTNYG